MSTAKKGPVEETIELSEETLNKPVDSLFDRSDLPDFPQRNNDAGVPTSVDHSTWCLFFSLDDPMDYETVGEVLSENMEKWAKGMWAADDLVEAFLMAQKLCRNHPKVADAIENFRLLRIEEVSDLTPLMDN